MKFVSKSGNLCITLKPGIPANQLSGTPSDPGLHVRFNDGTVSILDEEVINKMKRHPGFGVDFFEVNEGENDPYQFQRTESEPGHVMSTIKYGQVESVTTSKKLTKLSPEMEAIVKEMAKGIALEMIKDMSKTKVEESPKGKEDDTEGCEPEEVDQPTKKVAQKKQTDK